jgi:hypothetical protein
MKDGRFGIWCVGSLMVMAGLASVGCGGADSGNGTLTPSAGKSGSGGSGSDTGSGGSGGSTGGSGGSTGGSGGSTGGSGGSTGGSGGSTGGSGGSTGGSGGSTGGTGGSSSGSGGSGAAATDDLLDEIDAHCERSCDSQYALDCAPPSSNKLVCEANCVAQTAQLGDFCLREYADYVKCQADGGHACVQDTPYPNSTCAGQQLAFSQCAQHLGCKRDCKVSIDLGCTTETHDACTEACIANVTDLPDNGACSVYREQIAMCRATQANPSCNGDEVLTPAACAYWVLEVGACVQEESMSYCDGWCYAANTLGCGGDDCAAGCAAKVAHETCGTAWTEMMDCALFFGDAACTADMGLMANGICESEVDTYTTCLTGMTM